MGERHKPKFRYSKKLSLNYQKNLSYNKQKVLFYLLYITPLDGILPAKICSK